MDIQEMFKGWTCPACGAQAPFKCYGKLGFVATASGKTGEGNYSDVEVAQLWTTPETCFQCTACSHTANAQEFKPEAEKSPAERPN